MDLPGVRWVFELPLVAPLLAGFLPQLVLRVFLALLPALLALLGRFEGLPAESAVEFGVVKKYFAFQARLCLVPVAPLLPLCMFTAAAESGVVRVSRIGSSSMQQPPRASGPLWPSGIILSHSLNCCAR